MKKQVPNRSCVPHLETEGVFLHPIIADVEKCKRDPCWASQLTPFERMHNHQTMASARRFAYFRPFRGLIPKDELDYILTSNYNHSLESFAEPADVYLQPETVGNPTWKRLQNTIDFTPKSLSKFKARDAMLEDFVQSQPKKRSKSSPYSKTTVKIATVDKILPYKYNEAHPVLISGISKKVHPSSVKLINSSHHAPQTNAGYSRQSSDGTYFQY